MIKLRAKTSVNLEWEAEKQVLCLEVQFILREVVYNKQKNCKKGKNKVKIKDVAGNIAESGDKENKKGSSF